MVKVGYKSLKGFTDVAFLERLSQWHLQNHVAITHAPPTTSHEKGHPLHLGLRDQLEKERVEAHTTKQALQSRFARWARYLREVIRWIKCVPLNQVVIGLVLPCYESKRERTCFGLPSIVRTLSLLVRDIHCYVIWSWSIQSADRWHVWTPVPSGSVRLGWTWFVVWGQSKWSLRQLAMVGGEWCLISPWMSLESMVQSFKLFEFALTLEFHRCFAVLRHRSSYLCKQFIDLRTGFSLSSHQGRMASQRHEAFLTSLDISWTFESFWLDNVGRFVDVLWLLWSYLVVVLTLFFFSTLWAPPLVVNDSQFDIQSSQALLELSAAVQEALPSQLPLRFVGCTLHTICTYWSSHELTCFINKRAPKHRKRTSFFEKLGSVT